VEPSIDKIRDFLMNGEGCCVLILEALLLLLLIRVHPRHEIFVVIGEFAQHDARRAALLALREREREVR
jgi:hypothetical protein